MSAPAGYSQLPTTGEYMKDSDGSGPYIWSGTAMGLSGSGGGGGGGGAVTVADGADVAEGAVADAAATPGGTGTTSAKLRAISRDQATGNASLATAATQTSATAASAATIATNTTGVATSALQTSGNVLTGAVTETAPATDTASSGLNGRLQRIAQRLTSLIVQVPAALGITTSAGSLSVAPASDAVFLIAGAVATRTDKSGTITTGATAQTIIASNAARKGFEIQNQSTDYLYFSTLATAVQTQPSVRLAPGQMYETPLGGAGTGAVSLIGPTTGQAFAAREWT